MTYWPHQYTGIYAVLDAIKAGHKRILLTSPTGGGKTLMMSGLIEDFLGRDLQVILYTNRKLLVDQTSRVLEAAGHSHGVRASGHEDNRHRALQVSSIQTELSRVVKRGTWTLANADLVIIDEAHLQSGPAVQKLISAHLAQGASVVGFTATPIDLGGLYDHLIVAGTVSELRACGALVPCIHYGPDEPDMRGIKLEEGKDLTEAQSLKAIMRPGLFGRVWDHFERLNPEHKPTILFAPGVKESVWFAQQFEKKGVSAAHIDGKEIYVDGKTYESGRELRDELLQRSQSGDIVVLCNRFVLREGIDAPWLAHGIFATVFGSLQSYLQSGGRLLRRHDSLGAVTLQDHGGNWWRHGSLNADRVWNLEDTANSIAGMRADKLRAKKEKEPSICPRCFKILNNLRCSCGFEVVPGVKSRPVVTSNGTMTEYHGDIFRPRTISKRPDGPKQWERIYWASRKIGRSFKAAAAWYAYKFHWTWPDPSWPYMPTNERDWYLPVELVPMERLTSIKEPKNAEG